MIKQGKRRRVLLIQAWWIDQILAGVARYAMARNWIVDCEMGWYRNQPKPWKGDGIIVYADRAPSIINFVQKNRAAVVDISTFNDYFKAPKVTISNEGLAEEAITHLWNLGFERFACINASNHPIDRLRYDCFQQAVKKRGGHFEMFPFKGLARHLARAAKPMALLTTKDAFAIEVIRICQDAHFHVPEEFAAIGINDTPIICDLTSVPLTSVNPNFEQNGYEAAALLDRLMDGKAAPKKPIVIPPLGVTLRRSTDTLFIPDLDTTKALRFLRDHFLRPIRIRDVSSGGPTQLRKIQKLFRQYTGRTLAQELTRLRIEHAKKLLRNPKAKIETIAGESGFASRTYFIRAFRRFTGMTPKAFRKQLLAPVAPSGL